jgi:hypothetical protein
VNDGTALTLKLFGKAQDLPNASGKGNVGHAAVGKTHFRHHEEDSFSGRFSLKKIFYKYIFHFARRLQKTDRNDDLDERLYKASKKSPKEAGKRCKKTEKDTT